MSHFSKSIEELRRELEIRERQLFFHEQVGNTARAKIARIQIDAIRKKMGLSGQHI